MFNVNNHRLVAYKDREGTTLATATLPADNTVNPPLPVRIRECVAGEDYNANTLRPDGIMYMVVDTRVERVGPKGVKHVKFSQVFKLAQGTKNVTVGGNPHTVTGYVADDCLEWENSKFLEYIIGEADSVVPLFLDNPAPFLTDAMLAPKSLFDNLI